MSYPAHRYSPSPPSSQSSLNGLFDAMATQLRLDTPSSSRTSLYEDANEARSHAPFLPACLLALWSGLIVIDGTDRLLVNFDGKSIEMTSVVTPILGLIAAILQLIVALIGITIATYTITYSARLSYILSRTQPTHVIIALFVVSVHAAIGSSISMRTSTSILAAIATALPRFQLLLAPALFAGLADRTNLRSRAMLTSLPPLFASICVFLNAIIVIFYGTQGGGLLARVSSAGRLPLLTFITGVIFAMWSAAGLLSAYSDYSKVIRIYIMSSVPMMALAFTTFVAVQPILAITQNSKTILFVFGGSSPTSLCALLFGAIAPTPYFLARHIETERTKHGRLSYEEMTMSKIEREFPVGKDVDALGFPSLGTLGIDIPAPIMVDPEDP